MTTDNDNYVNELSIWAAYCIFCTEIIKLFKKRQSCYATIGPDCCIIEYESCAVLPVLIFLS
ncbi:hypothetical protein FT637_29815 [Bacillus cereus]|nr:hypothetical protein [Bacillus cereus]